MRFSEIILVHHLNDFSVCQSFQFVSRYLIRKSIFDDISNEYSEWIFFARLTPKLARLCNFLNWLFHTQVCFEWTFLSLSCLTVRTYHCLSSWFSSLYFLGFSFSIFCCASHIFFHPNWTRCSIAVGILCAHFFPEQLFCNSVAFTWRGLHKQAMKSKVEKWLSTQF